MLLPCFLRKRRFSFLSCRSSRPEVFRKKGVFRNCAKFTGKYLRQSLFFNKVAGLRLLLNSFFLNRGGFLFTYFIWISWNQIKCNDAMKYTLNCVSWNSQRKKERERERGRLYIYTYNCVNSYLNNFMLHVKISLK